MYISLSFAVIQCNGNNNKFTHHHHSLIYVRPHYFHTSHVVTRVPCCCCCCEWCDVAVDLQTDKTQSSDTWWARSAARECCLRPGPGGDTLTGVWSVCTLYLKCFFVKTFSAKLHVSHQSEMSGIHLLVFIAFLAPTCVSSRVWPPWSVSAVSSVGASWGWGDHMWTRASVRRDQGVSHGAGLSVTQTWLVSNVRDRKSVV